MSEISRTGYVVLGRQTAKGTPAASLGAYGLRVTSNSLTPAVERLDDVAEIGGGRDYASSSATMGGFRIGGSLEGLFRPKAFGLLLLGLGFTPAAPVQDGVTGAYTHTWTPGNTFTYLTVETRWGQTDAIRRFVDCLVDRLSWNLDANGRVTWSADLVGLSEAWQGTPSVPVYETDPVADYAGSAITLDALGTYRFPSVSCEIGNNLSTDEWIIGSRLLDDTTAGAREVTLSGTLKAGTNTPSVTNLYRAAVYGSKTATAPGGASPYHTSGSYVFGSGQLVGTSLTVRYGATITVADAVLNGFPLEASGDDLLTADFEAKAYLSGANVASIDLRNAFATAYTAA